MKRVLSLFVVLVMLLTFVSSCSLLPEDWTVCTVKFYVDDELYDIKTVTAGGTVSAPSSPEKDNEIFVTWVTKEYSGSYRYNFSEIVMSNLELHAYFTPDAASLSNMINKETIRSVVTIKNKCYNTVAGGLVETNSNVSQGSGVVVDISGGYCYVLTNHHVVEMLTGYSKQNFTIEDPWGEIYEAQLYRRNSQSSLAMSEEYDLALLCFKYSSSSSVGLKEIRFGKNPESGESVVAIGTPEGLQNAVSYGQVLEYNKINAGNDESLKKVKFDVIVHNAAIDHGSSGGALIDTSGKLVGINFAGYSDGVYGCAIPISKVIEFMNEYVY